MSKPTAPWAIGLAFAASLVLPACSTVQAESRELRLTAAQLTRQLQPSFPQKRCLLGLACLNLRNPVITLHKDDQRLFVAADVGFDLNAQEAGKGKALIAGVPRYDSKKGAFFLDRPQVESLDVAGLGRAELGMARQLLNGMLAEDILADQPIWTLDESDPQQAMARLTLRKIQVREGILILTMGDDEVPLDEGVFGDEGGGSTEGGTAGKGEADPSEGEYRLPRDPARRPDEGSSTSRPVRI